MRVRFSRQGGGSRPGCIGLSVLAVAMMAAASANALAQDLVYTPINPSFGGNALNSSHLLGLANAQRDATASDADDELLGSAGSIADTQSSDADLFVRQLQGRLLSALAAQVTESIFGDNPQDNGLITFGDTTVSFERTLDSIALTITNTVDGTVTQIVVPQLVTSN
ncbi:curli assembly protein CsgF [Hoeflea sp.]|uniref:curli assembly protein CsgF n=1 Tax=Hoeflea sp. TaxID=1940281 RepID=UPI003A8E14F0